MSDPLDFVDNSIGQLLVALADGVREAEHALAASPDFDENGRAVTRYALPYLDFTINVDVEVATPAAAPGGGPRGLPVLRMFTSPSSSGKETREIRSQVSGRIVAIPTGDGLPVPRIRITPSQNTGGAAGIAISVSNTAGEVLADQPLELNIDLAASATLSAARGVTSLPRRAGTRLAQSLLVTDEAGAATARLLIDPAEPMRAVFVVTASIGPFSAQASILAEPA